MMTMKRNVLRTIMLIILSVDTYEIHAAEYDLLVSDYHTGSVLRYDGDTGGLIGDFIPKGLGGLTSPTGLAIDENNNLYVGNWFGHNVLKYNIETGDFVDEFVSYGSGGMYEPWDLEFGCGNNLYVNIEGSAPPPKMFKYSGFDGVHINFSLSGKPSANISQSHFVIGTDGNIYVSGPNVGICRFDGETGEFIDELDSSSSSSALIFGSDGYLYATNWSYSYGNVLKYDVVSGECLGEFVSTGSGGLQHPTNLIFGPDGNLYVASAETDSILRYDGQTGEYIDVFANVNGLTQAFDMTFIPEPCTISLIAFGLLLIRKRHRA